MKKGIFYAIFLLMLVSIVSAAGVERSMSSTVAANGNLAITLTATGASGDYFVIVRDNIPSGWTYVSGGAQEGTQVKAFLSSMSGGSVTYTLRAPSSATTSTFTGTCEYAGSSSAAISGPSSVTVTGGGCTPQCASPSTVACGTAITPTNGCGTCPSGTMCSTGTCTSGTCSGTGTTTDWFSNPIIWVAIGGAVLLLVVMSKKK